MPFQTYVDRPSYRSSRELSNILWLMHRAGVAYNLNYRQILWDWLDYRIDNTR